MDVFSDACLRAADEGCDAVIVAGDLFHTGRPSSEAVFLAMDRLRECEQSGAEIVFVAGNHEWIGTSRHLKPRSPGDLFGLMGWHAPAAPRGIVTRSGLWVGALPWPRGAEDGYTGDAARLAEEAARFDGPKLAVAHVPIAEACLHPGSEADLRVLSRHWSVPAADMDLEPFGLVKCGHIHRRQDITGTLGYVGSLDRFTFSDEGQSKGFSLLTADSAGSWSEELIVSNRARQFRTVTVDADLDDLPVGALVRVELRAGETAADVDRNRIAEAGGRLVRVEPPPSAAADTERAEPLPDTVLSSPGELLAEWSDRNRLADGEARRLADLGDRLLGWKPPEPSDDLSAASDGTARANVLDDWSVFAEIEAEAAART